MKKIIEYLSTIYKWINMYSRFYVLIGFIVINIIFMNAFWQELLFDQSQVGARYGEVFTAEWAMDQVYNNIIMGRNPFSSNHAVLYPFGIDYSTTDSGNGLLFVFLRPFLSPHQSLSAIVAFGLFMASLGMYVLLRKFRIHKMTAFIISAMFGYMTFLMPRLGHLNYMSIYIFPWFYFNLISAIECIKIKQKILYVALTGFFFVMTLYLNAYYFIMLIISLIVLSIYILIVRKKKIFADLFNNRFGIIVASISVLVLIWPWLEQIYKTKLFEGLPSTYGWGGAIQFSSDLFGYFIPSIYSYFLHSIGGFWGTHFTFANSIFEQFTYPGITILVAYAFLMFLFLRKKLPKKLLRNIRPFFIMSIIFWLLTLGPFLHVFGRWGLTVDEEIKIVIPLPYIILHYIPFLANIRVPARLIVAFIFFAYIVTAYIIDFFLASKSKKFITFFYVILFAIFIIDHYFYITSPASRFIPYKAYEYLKQQSDNGTVLQIPSVVRDGFLYFGSPDAIELVEGQGIHGKPMLGGYMGRIPSFKRDYYIRNPFLGYIGRVMDPALETNVGINNVVLDTWEMIDMSKSIDVVNFLNIKYVIFDQSQEYSPQMLTLLSDLGFQEKMKDNNISVLVRESSTEEFLSVDVGSPNDDMYLGVGWYDREQHFRWAQKRASVMFKVESPRDYNLVFTSEGFNKPQEVTVYINEQKVDQIVIPTIIKEFSIPVYKQYITKGINTIHFISSDAYRPSEVIPGNEDMRQLSYKFFKIALEGISK